MGVLIAISAIFNLGLNMLLIPLFGLYGSAVDLTLLSQILMFTLFYIVANKKYPIPYELKNIAILIGSGICLILVSLLTRSWPLMAHADCQVAFADLLPVSVNTAEVL